MIISFNHWPLKLSLGEIITIYETFIPLLLCFDMHLICARDRVDGVMDAQGFERSYTVNSSILLAIQPHLVHFHQLLLEPPKVHEQRPLQLFYYFLFIYYLLIVK